jgi:hypothetical protein
MELHSPDCYASQPQLRIRSPLSGPFCRTDCGLVSIAKGPYMKQSRSKASRSEGMALIAAFEGLKKGFQKCKWRLRHL